MKGEDDTVLVKPRRRSPSVFPALLLELRMDPGTSPGRPFPYGGQMTASLKGCVRLSFTRHSRHLGFNRPTAIFLAIPSAALVFTPIG
ncbi:hypothetical protein [Shewanella sp. YLB-07]|uniref:hypothetical protein n=1 Tax=Shewanella sp. YLB-07 TaxID=2601268 RepID=UPI00128D2971|nr:hypothetical protein [Shewanella sp. YLB-07]MPY23859.1 hypothetical protein [Shewanella sp. YLB-07]